MRSARTRRDADRNDEVGAVAQFAHKSASQQRAQLRPFIVPANRERASSAAAPRGNGAHRIAPQRNLFDVLDQAKRFIFVPPEFRRITPRRRSAGRGYFPRK